MVLLYCLPRGWGCGAPNGFGALIAQPRAPPLGLAHGADDRRLSTLVAENDVVPARYAGALGTSRTGLGLGVVLGLGSVCAWGSLGLGRGFRSRGGFSSSRCKGFGLGRGFGGDLSESFAYALARGFGFCLRGVILVYY